MFIMVVSKNYLRLGPLVLGAVQVWRSRKVSLEGDGQKLKKHTKRTKYLLLFSLPCDWIQSTLIIVDFGSSSLNISALVSVLL